MKWFLPGSVIFKPVPAEVLFYPKFGHVLIH